MDVYKTSTILFPAKMDGLDDCPKYPIPTYGGLPSERLSQWEQLFSRGLKVCCWNEKQALQAFNMLVRGEAAFVLDDKTYTTAAQGLRFLKTKYYPASKFGEKFDLLRVGISL